MFTGNMATRRRNNNIDSVRRNPDLILRGLQIWAEAAMWLQDSNMSGDFADVRVTKLWQNETT